MTDPTGTEPTAARRLLPYGADAVVLECADLADALGLVELAAALPPVREVVPGARTLLLRTDAPLDADARRRLLSAPRRPPADVTTDLTADDVTLPVVYDGPDLAAVATLLRMSPDAVVAAHTGQVWTVGFCGFAPGFGYLVGEHDRLRVPRRDSPRTTVPAGAVGLADAWSGVYPRSGPGGWQLLGRTDAVLFDVDADPPALLRPGTRVRFEAR